MDKSLLNALCIFKERVNRRHLSEIREKGEKTRAYQDGNYEI